MFISRYRYNQLIARADAQAEAARDARKLADTFRGNCARIAQRYAADVQVRPGAARLTRALRACARYRQENALLAGRLAALQNSYDHAVGLDDPDIETGMKWQERRNDKAWPKFEGLD